MDQDYFSIDSILGGNQRIQCVFKQDLPNLGHLGGGSDRDATALSKIQIPIWLAYVLIYSDWADFNIPTAFGPRVRNALKAEARSVRLAGLVGAGGLWYGFGKTISDILAEEQANEFSEMLIKVGFFSLHLYSLLKRQTLKTFRARLIEVIDQAQHFAALGPVGTSGSSGDIAQMFREGLDAAERELFSLAQESAKRTKKWYEENDRPRR
ncbi:DNA replication complex GINS protein PSF3 [Termitomyces sp. J132]|nr:DNA replication complex GINS protein PSF3 [Termitomyces sp. J132]